MMDFSARQAGALVVAFEAMVAAARHPEIADEFEVRAAQAMARFLERSVEAGEADLKEIVSLGVMILEDKIHGSGGR